LLEVTDLKKYYPITGGPFGRKVGDVKALDGVSFRVGRGETLGIVGESGCGKSTLGKAIIRLIEPTSGEIRFDNTDIVKLAREEMRRKRKRMQIIFQDPYASLDPRQSIEEIIGEPLKVFKVVEGLERRKAVLELMDIVGLSREMLLRYPHEFSGGQRQRIGVARALALRPELIVCDEPVSALDVSIQSQILNLLSDLQKEFRLTYIFIAHGLSVIRHISDRIGVMYLGKFVEMAEANALFDRPSHPYTRALLSAAPTMDPRNKAKRVVIQGDVPSPVNPPAGCRFSTRCPHAKEVCRRDEPPLLDSGADHLVACHFWDSLR
jgi:oligopeptide/dipeptide ABC transporter ATP-binding protein